MAAHRASIPLNVIYFRQSYATQVKPMSDVIPNTPQSALPLIGREHELDQLTSLLASPDCRLLTLVGSGGIGKTRVALELATRQQPLFADGVFFIALQPLSAADALVPAIAQAIACPLFGADDPRVPLLTYLHHQHMLLVLDNFEHLLDSVDLLSDIITLAPEIKLLVTSREALNVQEEWRYALGGLSVPTGRDLREMERASAVQLFVERARRIQPDFSLATERESILQICRLVDGMPLALELAAAWVGALPCATIADEIAHNFDLLTTRLRNVPTRHRSMRAAFTHSWQLLTQEQQHTFAQLSIFRGKFDYMATRQVIGASLSLVAALVDKSLLHTTPDGRYQMHELLRQYAAEHLETMRAESIDLCQRHCMYYAAFVAHDGAGTIGGNQHTAAAAIAANLENIQIAWQWALEYADLAALEQIAHPMAMFFQIRSRYREGATMMAQTAQVFIHHDPEGTYVAALVKALVDQGFFHLRLGQFAQAQESFAQAQARLDRTGLLPPPGHTTDPLLGLGFLALIQGRYQEATRLAEAAHQRSESIQPGNLPAVWYIQAEAALAQGHYEQAQNYAQQAYTTTRSNQDHWFLAYCLNLLGRIACALEKYDESHHHAQESYAIREAFDDAEGMAVARTLAGKIALLQGQAGEAQRLYEHSLALYQDLGDQGGIAASLNGLGMAACNQGNYQDAHSYLRQALQIAAGIQFMSQLLAILTSSGMLLLQTGYTARAYELLHLALKHPASDRETRKRAQQLLDRWEADPASDPGIAQQTHISDLETVVTRLQSDFPRPVPQPPSAAPPVSTASPTPDPSLLDPLTARECDVLRLIVAGHSNKDIARTLVMSVSTVKWYTSQIYSKLAVRSRTQAIVRAHELHLVE